MRSQVLSRGTAARGLAASAVAAALCTVAAARSAPVVPGFSEVRSAHRPSDARLLDRHGELLHEVRIDLTARRLRWVSLQEISPALRDAVIASEDRRFLKHRGVDGTAFAAAAWSRLRGGARRGASTITMQLAGLLEPALRGQGGSRGVVKKWRQIRAAWALERRWSKAQILEAYLNRVTFRGEVQGVGAAASVLFGKRPHGLDEAEAAVLAALLRSPNAGRRSLLRRARVLAERVFPGPGGDLGKRIDAAAAVALDGASSPGLRAQEAPHAARRLLSAREPTEIRSTLDAPTQRVAGEILRRHLLAVRERNVRDAAVLVVENRTGNVLAYVGGAGGLSSARFVDGIRARRQAGSTLKPFLYGLAFERRILTPATLLDDAPLELPVPGGVYRPENYDELFRGLVTARVALASSLNIPAVRTVVLVGPEALVGTLRRAGFGGIRRSGEYYGPSLALGSADVTLEELVNAYRAIANGGMWTPLRMSRGKHTAETGRRVFSEAAAFLVADILADRESRTTTFGLENPLATRFWSAVKTGTSKDMRDNWCVGFSSRYTAGVWVGNFSGEPMHDVSGISGAAPVWLDVMRWLHRAEKSSPPQRPHGIVLRPTGPTTDIAHARSEWFLEGTEPVSWRSAGTASFARIVAPVPGAVIALDPDIPFARQRVAFQATPPTMRNRWRLDGEDLGPANTPLVWEARPGRHSLSLLDPSGDALDRVEFEVRP